MALEIETVERIVYYYELEFAFKDTFKAPDGDQFRELFAKILKLVKDKGNSRYKVFGERAVFIQDLKITPADRLLSGKLRCVRKDILPELMDTETDTAREIAATDKEGLVETTHFIIDFSKKKKRLAIEHNQFGSKVGDFERYISLMGEQFSAIEKVSCIPVVKDELKTLKSRINRCSEFVVKVHRDNINEVKSMDGGLYTALASSIDHYKSEYAMLDLKFDYRKRANTKEISSTISRLIDKLIGNPEKTTVFSTLEVRAEDSKKGNRLELFDLLVDRVKDRIRVEKKERHRTVVTADILTKMQDKLSKL